ncbi:DUF599 domain-containing protein [Terrihabitans sp. B22-R8]|uniref:DUF599 domain-containing protein n=1 Tax=Terrihabitans sp. B22-R8 TaxID=3425128 RepID=UPI00403C20D0
MSEISLLDYASLAFFLSCWLSYYAYLEISSHSRNSLNVRMHEARLEWMRACYRRENRILDGQLIGGLQNGTAFFASSSLIAIGGTLSALGVADRALELFAAVPFTAPTTRAVFEIKVLGLALIFTYSFFKLVWSYRLFNYAAILIGVMPPPRHPNEAEVEQAVQRAARMNIAAARNFNRGLRAFFFAIAYLGWFAGPIAFIATTSVVAIVLWRRQFASESLEAASWTAERP